MDTNLFYATCKTNLYLHHTFNNSVLYVSDIIALRVWSPAGCHWAISFAHEFCAWNPKHPSHMQYILIMKLSLHWSNSKIRKSFTIWKLFAAGVITDSLLSSHILDCSGLVVAVHGCCLWCSVWNQQQLSKIKHSRLTVRSQIKSKCHINAARLRLCSMMDGKDGYKYWILLTAFWQVQKCWQPVPFPSHFIYLNVFFLPRHALFMFIKTQAMNKTY